MPLLTLEYSKNLSEHIDPHNFLLNAHVTIAKLIDTNIESCKSRWICHENVVIGTGGDDKAFAILTVDILPGRDEETKKGLGEALNQQLSGEIATVLHSDPSKTQISVHIKDLSEQYFKHVWEKIPDA